MSFWIMFDACFFQAFMLIYLQWPRPWRETEADGGADRFAGGVELALRATLFRPPCPNATERVIQSYFFFSFFCIPISASAKPFIPVMFDCPAGYRPLRASPLVSRRHTART